MKTKSKNKKGKHEEDYFGQDAKPKKDKEKVKNAHFKKGVAHKVLKDTKVKIKEKPPKKEKWSLDEKAVKSRLTDKQFQKRINPATGRFEAIMALDFTALVDHPLPLAVADKIDTLFVPAFGLPPDESDPILTDCEYRLFDSSAKKQLVYVHITADPEEVMNVINPPPKAPTPASMEVTGTQTGGTRPDGSHYMNPPQTKAKVTDEPKMTAIRNDKYIVPAEVKAGDMLIAFDAMPFFRDGDPAAIVDIAEVGWEDLQNEVTDVLVDLIMAHDKRVGGIHDVDGPYTLTVDVQAAKTWLEQHRPEVYEKIAS